MAYIESQQANHPPGNSYPRSVLPQQQNHVPHDVPLVIPCAICTGQLEGQRVDVPPVVDQGALQGTVQNLYHTNLANYDVTRYQAPPGGLAGPYTYPTGDIGLVQGIPEHVQASFTENQGNESFGYTPQGVVPGFTQASFPGPSSGHWAPALGQPAAENLRRLASRYVNHPDSQVDVVRMEPGYAGRYKVVIVLDTADFI